MLKNISYCFISLLLLACGGGGDSSTSNSQSSLPNSIQIGWDLKKPQYSGSTDVYQVSQVNANEVTASVIESLDFLNIFAFGEYNNSLLFLSDNNDFIIDDDAVCETGSVTTEEIQPNERIEIIYNNCVTDGTKTHGSIKLKVKNAIKNEYYIIPSLTLEELSSGETSELSGYVEVEDSNSAIYHLLITSGPNEQLWFDNFVLTNNRFFNEYGVFYSGDIYISDQGKLVVQTNTLGQSVSNTNDIDTYSTNLTISGTNDIILDVEIQNKITMFFSDEFLPAVIPLTTSFDSIYSETNLPPTAVISSDSMVVDRGESLQISALNSRDPDGDLLTFDWDVISKPNDSEAILLQSYQPTFSANQPGEYVVQLTVTDTLGEVSITNVNLEVLKNKPEGQIELTNENNFIGSDFIAQIELENDELDGPYNYKIKYGPANMAVSSDGQITWDGFMPDYGFSTDVNFAIYVENEHKNSVVTKTITMNSVYNPIMERRTANRDILNKGTIQVKNGSVTEIYFGEGSSSISKLVIDNDKLTVEDKTFITDIDSGSIAYQAISDVNSDGVVDYWYTLNDDSSQIKVMWLNGHTKETNEFLTEEVGNSHGLGIQLVDYDRDGSQELVLSSRSLDSRIISIDSKELITTIPGLRGKYSEACDLNQDGYIDFIAADSVIDAKNSQIIPGTESISTNINFKFGIVNHKASNKCNLIYKVGDDIVTYDVNSQVTKTIYERPIPFYYYRYQIGNFDGDDNAEVLITVGKPYGNELFLINDLLDENVTITQLSLHEDIEEFDIRVNNPITTRLKVIADIDGDGLDELLVRDFREPLDGVFQYGAYNIIENVITPLYTSDIESTKYFSIYHWAEDDTLTMISDSSFAISNINLPLAIYNLNSNLFDISIEDNKIYTYISIDNRHLVKQDVLGNEIWRVDVQQDSVFGIDKIKTLDNGLILTEHYPGVFTIFSPQSGQVLSSFPVQISQSDINPFMVQYSTNDFDYIANYDAQNLIKIDKNYNITAYDDSHTELNRLHEKMDFSLYTFVQLDDDPLLELVVYEYTGNFRYKALDLANMTIEPPSDLFDGVVHESTNIGLNYLLKCFEWDNKCQNAISHLPFSKSRNKSRYQVVDKLTGTVIWSSPLFGSTIENIHFKRTASKIETGISFFEGDVITFKN
jgi:hypothetical protein